MAAIARNAALIACIAFTVARADQASNARAQLETISNALSAGNAVQALTPFDHSCPTYDDLSKNFEGLTGAYQIFNEIDITDEQDSPTEIKLVVSWGITLRGAASNDTEQRRADINIRLVLKNGKWKIVEFAPIAIFDPQPVSAKRSR